MQRAIDTFNENIIRDQMNADQAQMNNGENRNEENKVKDKKSKRKKRKKKNMPKMRQIRNFAIVPICSMQRRYVRIDRKGMYDLLSQNCMINRVKGKRKQSRKMTYDEYAKDGRVHSPLEDHWKKVVNLDLINKIGGKKKDFHHQFLTNGVAINIIYTNKESNTAIDEDRAMEKLKESFCNDEFDDKVGIDPNMKTWLACVRTVLKNGKETNIKISSGQYHNMTKQNLRNKKVEKIAGKVLNAMKNDLNNRNIYERTPSPNGANWLDYIRHKLKFYKDGVDVFTKRKYARLELDKYIESQRTMERVIEKIVRKGKKTIFFIGSAQMNPSSPIKKYMRCPGTRKLVQALKKYPNIQVVYVDEYMTSQVCMNDFKKFPERTKKHRQKKCDDCARLQEAQPASIIVTNRAKRTLQRERRELRENDPELAAQQQQQGEHLVSKLMLYNKTIRRQPNAEPEVDDDNAADVAMDVEGNAEINHGSPNEMIDPNEPAINRLNDQSIQKKEKKNKKTVWHRDIAAAKAISYKGELIRCYKIIFI